MARTFGDDPVVQTVALFFLLSPGLRHLHTAKRDGGVWGARGGGACGLGSVLLGMSEGLAAARTPVAGRRCAFRAVVSRGSQGGEMPEKKTVRRRNGAFRIFARTLRTRATPNDERKQGIRSSHGNATRLERASRWLDRKGV